MRKLYPYLLLLSAASCSKKDTDNIAPVITITRPVANTHFFLTDSLVFTATISDNTEISSVSLRVIDSTSFSHAPQWAVRVFDIPVNKKDYLFKDGQFISNRYKTALRYTISATDLAGNKAVEELIFQINQ